MKFVILLAFLSCIKLTISQYPNPDPDYANQQQWEEQCTIGKSQSPILIFSSRAKLCPSDKQFDFKYQKAEMPVHPFGKNLRNVFSHQSYLIYIQKSVQTKFTSSQFHWHLPSQHWIDGQRFDMELHVLHVNNVDVYQYGVVSILFKIDPLNRPDIFDEVDFVNDSKNSTFPFPFDLQNKMAFHYKGSLTTPLCDPTVDWFVYKDPFLIRRQNLQKIKLAVNDGRSNARYSQNLNGRPIQIMGGLCRGQNRFSKSE